MALSYRSIKTPAEVRLALFLIKILNFLWIKAMVMGQLQATGTCLANVLCFDGSWLLSKLAIIMFSKIVSAPATRALYVCVIPFGHDNISKMEVG